MDCFLEKEKGRGIHFLFVKQYFFYSRNNRMEITAYLFVLKADNSIIAFTL